MSGKPKPAKLKLLEGNRGRREIPPEPEPRPAPPNPRAPAGLNKEAKRVWRRLAPILSGLGLLTEADYEVFAHLCDVESRLLEIRRRFVAGANIVEDGRQSPLAVAEKQYLQTLRMYAAEFGLTPRGRAGLSIGSSEEDLLGSDILP